ncbi:MAG: hypothetical protein WAV15_01115 [Minisyncoccia bacterium]
MRKIVIKPKKLHKLAKEFIRSHALPENNLEGGRPKTYSDSFILTVASIQRLGGFSFREALKYCENSFSEVPSLSSFHERLKTFPQGFVSNFITQLGV